MDEYSNAFRLSRLAKLTPYSDFQPYTTLLALYLQRLPFEFVQGDWNKLVFVKTFNVVAVAMTLFWTGKALLRRYSPVVVVSCLFALVLHSTFLERSGALRVDMLCAAFGLVSLVYALEGKYRHAGIWVGVAFLATQKGALFIVAWAIAEIVRFARFRDRASLRRLFEAGLFTVIPVIGYLILFSSLSSFSNVFDTVFVKSQRVATEDLPNLSVFWWQTLKRNPFFYAVSGLSLLVGPLIAVSKNDYREEQKYLSSYGGVLFVLCLFHKQPWPYFFVMLLPTATVVIIVFLDQLCGVNRKIGTAVAGTLVVGAVCLAVFRVPVVLKRDAVLQRTTMNLAKGMLGTGDSYLAGVPMLWERDQVPELRWLDHQHTVKLHEKPFPAFGKLKKNPPLVIIWSHRIANLPTPFLEWFKGRYTLLGANVLAPGTRFDPQTSSIQLWKTGTYKLILPPGEEIALGDEIYQDGAVVELTSGIYSLKSGIKGRIVLWPKDPAISRLAALDGGTLYYRPYTF